MSIVNLIISFAHLRKLMLSLSTVQIFSNHISSDLVVSMSRSALPKVNELDGICPEFSCELSKSLKFRV